MKPALSTVLAQLGFSVFSVRLGNKHCCLSLQTPEYLLMKTHVPAKGRSFPYMKERHGQFHLFLEMRCLLHCASFYTEPPGRQCNKGTWQVSTGR